MPKSKYPQQLDTSIEIPPVRDNILEVGSDVINSLRSAIFNIEKVLGINPQGAVGNSVSERLNKALDGNGNIKPDALSKSNLLTGPIIDSDVSRVAGIKEEKLRLDFPTRLLQSEISGLNSTVEGMVSRLELMATELAIHTNQNAINRHPATAISIADYTSTPSDLAVNNISNGSVSNLFHSIFDSHINYTGLNISQDNNSHSADQVYFDNSAVSLYISSDDVQSVLEEVVDGITNAEKIHQDIMHSNGILRIDNISSSDDSFAAEVLFENVSVSFIKQDASSLYFTTILINDSIDATNLNINKSDILKIYSPANSEAEYTGNYEVVSYTTSGGLLTTITILGTFNVNSDLQTVANLSRKIKDSTNITSLLVSPRETPNLTSCKTAQVCHPNSTRAISSGINPLELSSTKKYIDISINNGSAVTIDLLYNGGAYQNIDTIVSSINKQCSENGYNFLAYRLDKEGSPSELVIACNIPDYDTEKYTIKISRSTDDGIDAAGFAYVEDLSLSAKFGSRYFILGKAYSGLGIKVDTKLFNFVTGSNIINSGASGVNMITSGVKPNDIIIITGDLNTSNNLSLLVTDVFEDYLIVSNSQLPSGFYSENTDDARFRIFKNIISFENATFDEVNSSTGSTLFDVLMDKNQNVFIDKRFEYTSQVAGSESKISLIDFYGEISSKQFSLDIIKNTNYISLSLDGGELVDVYGENNYVWVNSGADAVSLKFYIPDYSLFTVDSNTIFYGFEGVSNFSNLLVSRIPYDNYIGRIVGGASSGVSLYKLPRGTVGPKDISSEAIEEIISTPRSELRSNGVIYGLEITNAINSGGLYSFDLQPGICYVSGKRLVIPGKSNLITNIDPGANDKIFIAIDYFGNVSIEISTPTCSAPFEGKFVCILAAIEFSSSNLYITDLRLFVNDLDLKLLNSITVSPQPGMGHFSDFGKAVKYARKFSEMFPRAGVPNIHLKSGVHNITVEFDNSTITYATWLAQGISTLSEEVANVLYGSGLVLDFPITISGEGDSSELKIRNKYTFSDITYIYKGTLAVYGNGYTYYTVPLSKFNSGFIKLNDFKMNNSRIVLADMNIKSGSDNLNFGIEIQNIIFDQLNYESPNPLDTAFTKFRSIDIVEISDATNNKGNIQIDNCKFIVEETEISGSAILISSAARTKNLSITNNKLINAGAGTSLISADIVSFTNADQGANIILLGNTSLGNTLSSDASRPSIYSGTSGWSDRISKSLVVGKDISSGGEYYYQSSKEISKLYLFNKTDSITEFIGSSAGASLASDSVTTSDASYTFYITVVSLDPASYFSVPLDSVIGGCKIKTITVGVGPIASVGVTIELSYIDSIASTKNTSYTGTATTPGIISTGSITTATFNISSSNILLNSSRLNYLKINHNHGSAVKFYYVKITYEFTSISDALGIE